MTVLQPPYTVEQRGARVLIVPQRSHPTQAPPLRQLCEVNAYTERAEPMTVANAIVVRLNMHDALVESLTSMLRHFGPRADGQKFTAMQKASLLQSVAILKQVSEFNEKKGNAA